jgi:hypothetical protein
MLEHDYVAGNPQLNGSENLVVVSGCSGRGKSSAVARRPGLPHASNAAILAMDRHPWNLGSHRDRR